jgi:eukaryotic-like serine/threonine-protein kinase
MLSGLACALAAGMAVWSWAGRAPTLAAAPVRTSVMVPENQAIAVGTYPRISLAISPDGTQIVYVGAQSGPLRVRSLSTLAVRELPGTAGGISPFFSPNGQWVGFFTFAGELKKIGLAGGMPVTVAQNIDGSGSVFGAWAADNTIIFNTLTTGLRRVSAETGAVTDLTTIDAAHGEILHFVSLVTPSSRAVLFNRISNEGVRIDAVTLDSLERRVVVENGRTALAIAKGHLFFERGNTIVAAPFDEERLTLTGPAVPLTEEVRRDSFDSPMPWPQLVVSSSGTLAYLPVVDVAGALGLVDRDGMFEPLRLPRLDFRRPRVSRDGHAVAYVVGGGQVHVYDRLRGSTTKLTEGGRDEGLAWHPDGRSVALFSTRKDAAGIFFKNLDGGERLLVPMPSGVAQLWNAAWSSDRIHLAYTRFTGQQDDIWVATMGDPPTTAPYLTGAADENSPSFSPDGEWLAYVSDESGREEVYVRRYPEGERLAVSTDGGSGPIWRRDGKELFFEAAGKMMAVSVTSARTSLGLGKPTPLFDFRMLGPSGAIEQYLGSFSNGPNYDVMPDGRFLMIRMPEFFSTRQIVVVQNFFEELKRLAPAK